jgi:cathepsin F
LIAPSIDAPSPENDQVIQAPVLQPLGAYQKADLEDENVKEMASFATTSLSQSMNSKSLALIKIISAEKQVVGGVNYKLVLELSDSSGSITCTVVVFDQSWTGTRKLSDSSCLPEAVRQVRNDPVPAPRQTGGFTEIDVEDETVKDIAQFATSTLSQSSNDGTPFNLVKIVSASKQVVAGANYKLSLLLSGSNGGQTCAVVVFDQSWTGTRKLSSFECVPFAVPPSSDSSSEKDRVIQAPVLQPLGAYQKADPEDENVKEMALFATTTLIQSMNSKSLALVKIVSAEKQIVGGVNYKLVLELSDPSGSLTCTAVVFDQAWTSTRKLSDSSCLPAAVRQVRQAGSFSDVDVNDATVKDIAQFATQSLSKLSNGGSPLSVIKITSASKQIVAGANYKLTLELSGSNGGQTCTVEVFDQSWTGTRKLNKFACVPFAEPPSIRVVRNDPTPSPPGSFSSIDVADPTVKEIATFATASISKSMNSGSLSLLKITSASKQVVAGANYKMSLQLSGSSGDLNCEVQVFDQSWTNTRELTKFNCVPAFDPQVQPAPIRQVGGYTAADPNAADVKEVASFATTTLSQSMNSGSLSLVEITSAEKQVVAGINYKLTLKLSGSAGSMTCSVVIFDQSWTGTRKVSTSNCVPDAVPATSSGSRIARNEPTKGEFVAVDGDDVDVKDVALFASSTLSSVLNPGEPLYLLKVASASKQVLGEPANYKLRLELVGSNGRVYCNVEVYDNPSTTRKLSSVGCVPESQPPPPVRRRRRSGGVMTGGFSPMDLKGSKVQELATFAAQTISQRSNEPGTPNVLRILKASKQVVSGMKYNLELDIGYSECTKDSESCLRRQRCTVSIWEQVWLQKKELTKMACKEVKKNGKLSVKLSHQPLRSRSRLGGVQPADPDSEEIRSQAALALESVQAQSNSEKLLNVVRIKSAATQVVSGKKTFLSLEIGQTKCNSNKTESTDSADCPFDDQADRQMCKVEIWSRPWLNERKVTSLKCIPLAPPKPCASGKSCPRNKRQSAASRRQAKNRKKVNRLKYMSAFRAYGIEFQKVYKTWSEFEHRYKIYRANQKRIELLNLNEMGTAVYGDTPFSDWTEKEFQERLTGLKPHLRPSNSILSKAVIPKIDLPDEFDWRHFNVVTPVKNQGSCGSCWAFSVTGNVEGVYGVKHGELVSLSEQELVDCDTLDSGCNGGLPENAYKAIQDLGGLEEENDYPYNGHDNKCDFNANITRVQVTGGVEISTNETEMAQWLVENGPISIGINANGMQFYRGGISHPWKVLCRPGGIDHGVLIVGYGVASYPQFKKTLPYWIVKNSWGTKWGEQGYYRVFRGDGTCGVNQMATSAVIA